jgi:protoporphyrinogen oxidase
LQLLNETKEYCHYWSRTSRVTAAYLLLKAQQKVCIFEKDEKYVGGISRTEEYKGFLFDIGGHRFFSKSKEVEDFGQKF